MTADVPYSYLRDRSINDVFFRYVANSTYDWESWHDPHGKLVWVNDAVERMTGYDVADCQTMADYPLPIVAERDRPKVKQMLADAIAGKSFNDLEFRITTKAGLRRWMAVSWQPMHDADDKHLGFRTSVRDITDRQALKDELRVYAEHLEQLVQERTARIAQLETHRRKMEKLAAVGELAAGVAHEINNPLAGIRNAFALIKDSLRDDHPHYDLLELVDAEIERISSIINQMYQLYRRNPQVAADLSIEKVVADVFLLLDPIATRHGVELKSESTASDDSESGDDDAVTAVLPEDELKQILFNLVRNAVQASQAGQVVKVLTRADDERVWIEVVDDGTGIDDEILPHIFEPFFSTKGQLKEGMGLGLSVTENLVVAMGGQISCQTADGRGTTFTVSLPRSVDEEASQMMKPAERPRVEGTRPV